MGQEGVIVTGAGHRWPGAVVPFEVDPNLPNPQRVTDAVAHYGAPTPVRFVPRNGQSDYVRFIPDTGSSSRVGRQGGRQDIRIAAGAPTGTVIHEMGHAIGLWHEQSREDRNALITVNFANIASGISTTSSNTSATVTTQAGTTSDPSCITPQRLSVPTVNPPSSPRCRCRRGW